MPTEACNFARVFEDESIEIAKQCEQRDVEADLRLDNGHAGSPYPDRLGIAFSGGGVRSASVALGVTQRLAKAGILRQAHYISGISGGKGAIDPPPCVTCEPGLKTICAPLP